MLFYSANPQTPEAYGTYQPFCTARININDRGICEYYAPPARNGYRDLRWTGVGKPSRRDPTPVWHLVCPD